MPNNNKYFCKQGTFLYKMYIEIITHSSYYNTHMYSERLLFNTKLENFQLYHGEQKLHLMK